MLATLHTNSAAESINRIIDVFPATQQSQIRAQLAFVLEGVLTQTLLQKARGKGRVMACEIMVATPAIRALIRDDKVHQIYSALQSGKKHGMQTLVDSLYQLYMNREVTKEECLRVASDPNEFLGAIGEKPMEEQGIATMDKAGRGDAAAADPDRETSDLCRCSSTPPNATSGQILKGTIDLPSRDEVIAFIRKNRMILVSVREAPTAQVQAARSAGVKTRDVVIFTRQFATMINAGLPLVQSLSILAQQTENKTLKDVTKAVVYDVEAGNTLADALRKHPKAFTELYVNMVAAGEAGGILDTILLRLATFLEKNDALVRKVKGAMVYPAVIIIGGGHRGGGAADLRDPDVRLDVRLGEPGAAAAHPGRDRRVATS